MNGAHLFHALHFLTHEWKIGGAIAIAGIILGFLLTNAPLTMGTDCMTTLQGSEYCFSSTINPEGLMERLGGAIVGGFIGAVASLILATLFGIKKEQLGIPDE